MREKLFPFCLSCALMATFQILAFAQNSIILTPQKNLPPRAERDSCVPVQTGSPSKLVEAIRADKFAEFNKLLGDEGEDVNAFHYDSETPLIAAVTYNRIEFVKELVKAGADVNKANSIGWTPLIYAAIRRRAGIAKILLAAEANVDQENMDGSTALLIAARGADLAMVEMLLEAGANLHHKDKRGRTAFLLSAEGGQAATMKMLLSMGFDPNSYSNGRYTALVGASRHPEMLKMLLSAGAKVNLQIPIGGGQSMTALEVAAQNGWTESVKILIEAGADPNLYYTPGVLPLDKALRANYTEIIELLKRAGAKNWAEIDNLNSLQK